MAEEVGAQQTNLIFSVLAWQRFGATLAQIEAVLNDHPKQLLPAYVFDKFKDSPAHKKTQGRSKVFSRPSGGPAAQRQVWGRSQAFWTFGPRLRTWPSCWRAVKAGQSFAANRAAVRAGADTGLSHLGGMCRLSAAPVKLLLEAYRAWLDRSAPTVLI
ncbi:MAG: hypothetical protein QE285_03020 [Aquabacterium sp.]|nr:hypothetical protein [Aquabacterium sp.]